MTQLAELVRGFAIPLKPVEGNDMKLTEWITIARAAALPHLRSFTRAAGKPVPSAARRWPA
ncbi:hypothetical protein [Streptomyces murinus]|uniref:hypothetical protein n=1 Tax=Streptomyces murinus TaxID=33900 RepID=UPI003F44A764